MRSIFSIPALILIMANVAAHALGGWSPVPGTDFSVLALMGWHHYAQMAVLLLLLLLARGSRDRLYPALAALAMLLAAAFRSRWGQMAGPGPDLLILPLSWALTALCAASAASGAVPPPEIRPGLRGFKKAVVAVNFFNIVLLALFGSLWADGFYDPGFQTSAGLTVFSLWLLIAAGPWANLSFIAGLASATPLLTAILVFTGQPGRPLEWFPHFYALGIGYQLAVLTVLSGLIILISLAVKAGVRLTGRARKPVRPLARAVFMFPAGAMVMAALLLPAARLDRNGPPTTPYQGSLKKLSVADVELLAPAGWVIGGVRLRLPLDGRPDGLIMAERVWASEEEADRALEDIDRRLGSLGYSRLGGDQYRLFRRPSWLIITPAPDAPARLCPSLEMELYIHQPGGAVKLAAAFDHDPSRDRDCEPFARRSAERFLEAARAVMAAYQWRGPNGQSRPAPFRTAFGAFDRPPEGLRLTALMNQAVSAETVYDNAVSESQPNGSPPVRVSSDSDWRLGPLAANTEFFDWQDGQAVLEALDQFSKLRGLSNGPAAPRLLLRWGPSDGPARPSGRISAWPSLDQGLNYYLGRRSLQKVTVPLAGLTGELEHRYQSRPPLSLPGPSSGWVCLTWTAADQKRHPLKLTFLTAVPDRAPQPRTGAASTLNWWEVMLGTLSLTGDFSAMPEPGPADEFSPITEPGPADDLSTLTDPGQADDSGSYFPADPGQDEEFSAIPKPEPTDRLSPMTEPGPADGISPMTEPGLTDGLSTMAEPGPTDGHDPYPAAEPVRTGDHDPYSATEPIRPEPTETVPRSYEVPAEEPAVPVRRTAPAEPVRTEPVSVDPAAADLPGGPDEPEEFDPLADPRPPEDDAESGDRPPEEPAGVPEKPPLKFNPVPAPARGGSR